MVSASDIKALYEYNVSGLAETLHLKVYIKEKPKKQSEHENYYYTKKAPANAGAFFVIGNYLLSQAVSSQVPSASACLTTVFGMGTGGSTPASSPNV